MAQRIPTAYNYIIVIVLLISSIAATIHWYIRKKLADAVAMNLRLVRISKSDFEDIIEKRKFSCMSSWVATPATRNFFKGTIGGFNAYLFSIAATKSTSNLSVLLKSEFSQLPNFIIKQKSFTEEVGDMLGVRKHDQSFPSELIDIYAVSSDDEAKLNSLLTPEITGYFMKNEGVVVEVQEGDLIVQQPIADDPENFNTAIENALTIAHLFGINPLHKQMHPTTV